MARFRIPLLNSLPVFEAAGRHLSFKRASDELHVTAAAVSRHIQKLELKLGRRLFKRYHKRVELTEDGVRLLAAVTGGLTQIDRVIAVWGGRATPHRLVISVDPDFAALWLVPRLAEFYALAPTVMVEILSERTELTVTLRDARVSCAIHYAPARKGAGNGELLFRSRLFPVCTSILLSKSPFKSSRDLRNHLLLHDRSITEWEEYHRATMGKASTNADRGMIFTETAHCLEAAARGQGVALGDDYLAASFLLEGRLIKPPMPSVQSRNAYYLVTSGGAATHRAFNTFREWLIGSIVRQRRGADPTTTKVTALLNRKASNT